MRTRRGVSLDLPLHGLTILSGLPGGRCIELELTSVCGYLSVLGPKKLVH